MLSGKAEGGGQTMMKVTFAIAAVVMSGFVLHYHIRMNRVRNSQNVIFDVMVISNAVTAVNDLVQTFFKVYCFIWGVFCIFVPILLLFPFSLDIFTAM